MGALERFRAWFSRTEQKANELDYAILDEVHKVETALDERTGGKLYDAMEKVDEEAEEVLERLGLDEEAEGDQPEGARPGGS